MDGTATNRMQLPRLVCVEDAFAQLLLLSSVLLPAAYLLIGWWAAAAVAGVIFVGCLFTPTCSPFVGAVFSCRRRPHPAASGAVVGGGGMGMEAAAIVRDGATSLVVVSADIASSLAIVELPAAFAFQRDVLAGDGWAQCAICLRLVLLGETVRRLPACGHLFHAGCVDEWLRAHPTCPLCRAAVRRPQRLPV